MMDLLHVIAQGGMRGMVYLDGCNLEAPQLDEG